ncbi:MAG: DUF1223 domain-containing protein [Deltaproteobacteria bacterium]|nr:DUF1223 domain-containing protein [Deltaproteobacteria bacterium]
MRFMAPILFAILLMLPLPIAQADEAQPVLVELFTSEGCSSCPPADANLQTLAKTQPVDGARVIPLSFHVAYWNRLGWKDPFSKDAFNERQYAYAKKFGAGGVYTPQMIVDGRSEFVGSKMSEAKANIREASGPAKLPIVLELRGPDRVKVTLPKTPPSASRLLVAVTEDGLSENVTRGENRGRTLSHIGVVRDLRVAAELPTGKIDDVHEAELSIDPSWSREHLKVVAFTQDAKTWRVYGAAVMSLAPSVASAR